MRLAVLTLALAATAAADELRPLSPDRPDVTESPTSVDQGHVQVELDLARLTLDQEDRVRRASLTAPAINLKVGLLHDLDLQLGLAVWTIEEERDDRTGERSRAEGWGDVVIRLKYNVVGNDGGRFALGLLPFVSLPTAKDGLGSDEVEGGLAVPFSVDLGAGFDLGAMVELDVVADEEEGHRLETLLTVTVGHDLVLGLGVFVELTARLAAHRAWIGTFDAGLTYAVTDDIQLDAGCNVGLTRAADDLEPFLGLTVRF